MKRNRDKKLQLKRQTIGELGLAQVRGGLPESDEYNCSSSNIKPSAGLTYCYAHCQYASFNSIC